jgi:putative ABC transport system permease protein
MMRLYRMLLRLYPASFRAEYEAEMCAIFATRRRDENGLMAWIRTIFDVLTTAPRVQADVCRQDLAWTLRTLRQSPGFTLTALTITALGLGATTAAFTLLDHVLLRPLPFPRPEQLMVLAQTAPRGSGRVAVTPPNYEDWRSMNKSFSSLGAYIGVPLPVNLSGQGEPARLDAWTVNADVFPTLDVRPALGRSLTAEDDRPGAPSVVMFSDELADALFGGASNAVGRTIRLDNRPYTIVGVMPPGFAFPIREARLWTPLAGLPPASWESRTNHMLGVIGRLRPDVSLEQARADLSLIARQLERADPKENVDAGADIREMRDIIAPSSRLVVLGVFGGAFCVLLIACSNLANLLFARAMVRRQELAVRVAIGAARERLVRQLLTESLVLALAGGVIGLALAALATPALAVLVPLDLPIRATPEMDWRVFGFAAALAVATSVVFGVGPAARSFREVDLNALRARAAIVGGHLNRLRSALVIGEIVATVVLLVGAGLLIKAIWRVQQVDPGFKPEGVLTLRTALPFRSTPAERRNFYSRVLSEARTLPGVKSAAYVSFVPMTFPGGNFPVTVPGVAASEESWAHMRFVTPDSFAALGIPLLSGRDISDRDNSTAPKVVVISQSLARRLWPGQDPIGRQINHGMVVGVVGDVAVNGLEAGNLPQLYLSAEQMPPDMAFYAPKDLIVRGSGNPAALTPVLRWIIRELNPEQAISDVRSLEEIVWSQTAPRRAQLRVLGAFAAIALLLAAVGIHGVLSFAVSTRTQEVGVRMALGAGRGNILLMFLQQGLVLGVGGIVIAMPLAYGVARGMTSLLFGVSPADPSIYGAAALLALIMTVTGSLRPTLRAARVDPAITIRSE